MKPLVVLLSAGALLAAAPAAAQPDTSERPGRPYRGLFASGVGDVDQMLGVNFSFGAGYSQRIRDTNPPVGSTQQPRGNSFAHLSGTLAYSLGLGRVGVNAALATTARYFPNASSNFAATYSGNVGASFKLTERTGLGGSHSTTYQPYRTLNFIADDLDPLTGQPLPEPDYWLDRSEYVSHASSVHLSHQLSRRSSLSGHYTRHISDFGNSARSFGSHGAGASYTLGLTRGLGFHAGYGFTEALYRSDVAAKYRGHHLNVGLHYGRALSISRRTSLSFSTGTSAFTDVDRTQYRLTGNARLSHEIGRTWAAALSYSRSAGFTETLAEPVFSDSASLSFGGMISRRVSLSTRASAALGDFALASTQNQFRSYTGSVNLNVALTRHLALGTSYSYYRHRFDNAASLGGLPREIDRQSVRVHLNVWWPLMYRARRSDAAR
jgi:hypothetical protein